MTDMGAAISVIPVCIFFLIIKTGEFLCSYFNIEDRRKRQYFWNFMLYYCKKGKNATEIQKKICAMYGQGAVTDWTCQKWLATFLAGDTSLGDAPWSGRLVEVDSNQIKTLVENSQHTQPNQVSKITCTSVVLFTTSMFQFHVSDKKTFLTVLLHVILYINITKHYVFKTDYKRLWKLDTVQ